MGAAVQKKLRDQSPQPAQLIEKIATTNGQAHTGPKADFIPIPSTGRKNASPRQGLLTALQQAIARIFCENRAP